jgi:hypothetical protein
MRTTLLKKRVLFFLLATFCFFPMADAIAESSTGSSPSSSSNTGSGSSSGSNSGSGVNSSGTTIQVGEGSFTPATMPASGDLAKKSTAAAAAAKAGAAMQQVNCMQMQAQAAAEQDPEAQYWKQMAAGMQCAQASQSQQSAEKNEENAKSLSGSDIPKAATFTAGSVSLSGGNSNESSLAIPTIETTSKSSSGSSSEETSAATAEKPSEESKAVAGNSTKTEEQKSGVEVPIDVPKSALNPIQTGPVVFDDSAKAAGGGAAGGQALMGNAGSGTGTTTAKNDKTASSEAIASEIADIERGIREINSAGGEGAGGDSDAPKSSGMLDALMAQLNPEAPQMGGFGGSEGAAQMVSLEKAAGKESKVNIFEYATYRYQMAAGTDGRVQKAGAPKKSDPKKVKLTATIPPTDLLSASRTR